MPVTFSSYRLGPGQRVSNKTVPPPWDWLLRRENELGPRRSKSRIIFAVLVPPLYVAVQAPALIVTHVLKKESERASRYCFKIKIEYLIYRISDFNDIHFFTGSEQNPAFWKIELLSHLKIRTFSRNNRRNLLKLGFEFTSYYCNLVSS